MTTFTAETYFDILDAIGESIHNPRRIGEPSQVDEVIARLQGPAPRIAEWEVRPDVPAKMERAAANRPVTPVREVRHEHHRAD